MKRIFPRRTLKWQLSLSYILLIMVAVPMLVGVGVALIALTPRLPPAQQLVWILRAQTAPQVTHEVQAIHDPVALNKWALNLLGDPGKMGWNALATVGVMIIDHNGGRIVPTNWQLIKPVAILFSHREGQGIVRAALANDQNLADLTFTFDDGQTIAAVPLLDAQGHPLGVLCVAVRGLTDNTQVPANPTFGFFWNLFTGHQPYNAITLATVVRLILLLIVIIGIIGSVFGMVMGRRITRRLQFITSATHAWSHGQFQAVVQDHSSDELGQLAQDLNQMALQVQTLLSTQQQLAILKERQRMARDLHDSVKQQIFAITLLIGAVRKSLDKNPTQAHLYLTEAEELADQTRQELTAIIQELRPLALADKGLAVVLDEYIHDWSLRTGIDATVCVQDMPTLPIAIGETIFRVTQEALTNVARHSGASRVEVHFIQEPAQVCLSICDNGRGFNVMRAKDKGMGLTTMHGRAAAHLGNVYIGSTTAGTCVEIRMPPNSDHDATGIQAGKDNIYE